MGRISHNTKTNLFLTGAWQVVKDKAIKSRSMQELLVTEVELQPQP